MLTAPTPADAAAASDALRIAEFNIEALLRCALPYHETNLFVRVVQLLRLSYGPRPGFRGCPTQLGVLR